MYKNFCILIFFLLLIFPPFIIYGQDNLKDDWQDKSKKFRLESIAKDILNADYNQLKSMAMSLGLKEEDNSEAYRKALAEYYGIKLLEKKSVESVNKIILKRAGELKIYQVKEIYYTIQGEGFHSGSAAVFCRF